MPLEDTVSNQAGECIGNESHHVEEGNPLGDFMPCIEQCKIEDRAWKEATQS